MISRRSGSRLFPVLIALAIFVGATAAGAAPEWTISPSPRPADSRAGQNSLLGVSCISRTNCFAVGHYVTTGGDLRTLIEHWNGSSWNVVPSPNAPRRVAPFWRASRVAVRRAASPSGCVTPPASIAR